MAQLPTEVKMTTPEHETMKPRILTLPLWLLILTASAWGQTTSVIPETLPARPLNLSLPRDVLRPAAAEFQAGLDDPASRNLRPERLDGGQRVERLPYGSGYETRQRGMTSSSGAQGGGGGRGGGRRGR